MKLNNIKNLKLSAVLGSILLGCFIATAAAEDAQSPPSNLKQKLEKIVKGNSVDKESSKPAADVDDLARPKPLSNASTDPETKRLYEKALQDYYAYRSRGLEHRGAVFRWQLFSAKVIFFVVLNLVICGIVFAGIQFRAGLNDSTSKGKPSAGDLASTIELGSSGVKISSPVLGIVILFLSLAFFYLYLVYVYPIENVF